MPNIGTIKFPTLGISGASSFAAHLHVRCTDMDVEIVAATVDRAEAFWRALDVVARERCYLLFLEAPPVETTRSFVLDLITAGASQFFAVSDGMVVGWCDIVRHDRPGMSHSGHLGMGVIPSHRGQGIEGLERTELEVFASNQRAHRLYVQSGFVEEGRTRNAGFVDGEYDDFIIMSLLRNT